MGATTYELCDGNGNLIVSTSALSTVEGIALGANRWVTREVKALVPAGETGPSNTYTAYTMANVPVLTSVNGGWNSTSKSYMTAVWTNPGGSNPAWTKYQLQKSNGTPVGSPLINGFTATDGGVGILNPNTLYHYNVYALNGNNTHTAPSITLDATTPPGQPATFTTSGVTTDAITWNWTAPTSGGQNRYNLYINGTWISTTEVSRITAPLDPCRNYSGTVEAVSDLYGTGEPYALNRWTVPVAPGQVQKTGDSATAKAVDIQWADPSNINPIYKVSFSLLTNEGWGGENSTTAKNGTFGGDNGSTLYYWRVRAMTGDGSAYSGYSSPVTQIRTSPGDSIPGIAPTISQVYIGNRAYRNGMVTGSRPRITATITYDAVSGIDTDYTYGAVTIDEDDPDPAKQIYFASSEVTYEAPGPGAAPYSYTLSALAASPMQGLPAGGTHTLKIRVRDGAKTHISTWTGYVGVMSGGVQMIGSAYNYPNPFRPLSTDPNQNTTRISYNLSVDAGVTLIIYDITGHEVYRKTYHSGTSGGQAGLNSVPFNGTSMFGEALGNGMYLYKIISGGSVIGSGKLVVLD
jgi:hypothetical protein